ncbi:hypothetical protein FRX31_013240 [Thalictrum thalictroides]|uniref:FAR1 domain-containing protein n=1 Tax=Thalictrum thalictroides TaxID=46969 RepID=A0A7J6WJR2_THATH|nr:hypothetical protein FRX31_013240 [Thalictrum thalictroides]
METLSEIKSISNSLLEVQSLNTKADSSLYGQKQFVSSQQENTANVENNVEYPDLSMRFTTDRVFETRSDLIQWAQKVGLTCGTVVVVSKSENVTSDGTRRLYLACERSGMYRDHRKKKEIDNKEKVDEQEEKKNKPRRTGTKKINCPFRLKGVFVRGSEDKWKVEVQCACHNHGLAISFEGRALVCGTTST